MLVLAVTRAPVFVLMLRFKLHAFVALIVAAMAAGVLAPRIPLPAALAKAAGNLGSPAGRTGIAMALAALVGERLPESRAADKITRRGASAAVRAPAFFGNANFALLAAAFGAMPAEAGAGSGLGSLAGAALMPPLRMRFLLAALVKAAQEAGTVAMIAAVSILSPLIAASPPPWHPVYPACASVRAPWPAPG